MYGLLYVFGFFSLISLLPLGIIFIVFAALKKKKLGIGIAWLACMTATFIFFIVGTVINPTIRCDHNFEIVEKVDATAESAGHILYHCEKCGFTKTVPIPKVIETPASAPTSAPTTVSTWSPTENPTSDPTQTAPAQKPTESPTTAPATEAPTLSYEGMLEKYKRMCSEISYEDLARNPEKYKGEHFKFRGEVAQVIEPTFGNITTLRVNVTEERFEYIDESLWTDALYCTVTIPNGSDRILEEDIITIWGECRGLTSYTGLLGQQVSIPEIKIYAYEIEE